MPDIATTAYPTGYPTVTAIVVTGQPEPKLSRGQLQRLVSMGFVVRDVKRIRALMAQLKKADDRLSAGLRHDVRELGLYGFVINRRRLGVSALVTQPVSRKVFNVWRFWRALDGRASSLVGKLVIDISELDDPAKVDRIMRVLGTKGSTAVTFGGVKWKAIDTLVAEGSSTANQYWGWEEDAPQLLPDLLGDNNQALAWARDILASHLPAAEDEAESN